MRGAVTIVVTLVATISSLLAGGGTPTAPKAGGALPSLPSGNVVELAADLTRAQQIIDQPESSTADLQAAGRLQQLTTVALARGSAGTRRAVLAHVRGAAAAGLRSDLAAASALAQLNTPRRSLPPWKITSPPSPATLLRYFKAAQARFRVPWRYLAAIEMIETDFGRVVGLSTAGAEGPMQFMPATWAEYGSGDVHNPRDAIFGAASYLVANGAPSDMSGAIYHYNPSHDYVRAVEEYARRMGADPRGFYGYYWWQVIYPRGHALLILPVGFPKTRPVRLTH